MTTAPPPAAPPAAAGRLAQRTQRRAVARRASPGRGAWSIMAPGARAASRAGSAARSGSRPGLKATSTRRGSGEAGDTGLRGQPRLDQLADLVRRHDPHEGDALEVLQRRPCTACRRVGRDRAGARRQRHRDDPRLQRQPARGAAGSARPGPGPARPGTPGRRRSRRGSGWPACRPAADRARD